MVPSPPSPGHCPLLAPEQETALLQEAGFDGVALFSLAGHQTRMPGALAISAVSTLGFAGILAGPALIGFAANHFGLIAAFIGVATALLLVALSTRWLRV